MDPSPMTSKRRTIPIVLAEIDELRRYAHDAPPHHGGGRHALEQQLRALEAELARLRATGADAVPDQERSDGV